MIDSVCKAEFDETKSQISAKDESVVGLLKFAAQISLTGSLRAVRRGRNARKPGGSNEEMKAADFQY